MQPKASNWPLTPPSTRGYGAQWKVTRKRILERDGYKCQCPQCSEADARGERRLNATHVDHKVSKAKAQALGWTERQIEADENLQSMNEDCHKRKTCEERGYAAPRTVRLLDKDGYPIT